jgi:hypothetical protein
MNAAEAAEEIRKMMATGEPGGFVIGRDRQSVHDLFVIRREVLEVAVAELERPDGETLRRAAAVLERRATKPHRFTLRVLLRLLRSIADDVERPAQRAIAGNIPGHPETYRRGER